MGCDALLKGTKVDGVYDKDPATHKDAKRYDQLPYLKVINEDLKVMDASAVTLMRENKIPIIVFSIAEKGRFEQVMRGVGVSTIIGT